MTSTSTVRRVAAVALASLAGSAAAQPAAPPHPAAAPPEKLQAKVIEVKGTVEFAPVGTDPLETAQWKAVEDGMQLGADTQIRTGLRSRCVLLFGDPPDQTVISVRRMTLASISDFSRSGDGQQIRIGLGYGAVRGGSSKGTLRSDVIIDSTVATLAKRGTTGFQIEVEPTTGHFRISLAESGLVEAISRVTNQRRQVRAGEYATTANIARMWINQNIFNRALKFYEAESVSGSDLDFMSNETTGLSILAPNGSDVGQVVRLREGAGDTGGGVRRIDRLSDFVLVTPPANRPEGNFGFGSAFRVQVPQRSGARPGSRLRRSVLPRSRIGR